MAPSSLESASAQTGRAASLSHGLSGAAARLWWVAAFLWFVTWTLLPLWSELVPPSDNVEQLVWSQGWELGYHKHPPLPTWILIGAQWIFPPGLLLTSMLSLLGMAAGGYFLWRLAAQLLGREAAWPVVLASACIAFYSYRAHIYNHNTVLVPFVYAAAWFYLCAVQRGHWRDWLLFGVACAGGMLAKYQFAIILVTAALIAVGLQLYRQPRFWKGAALAAASCALLLLPHLWWLVTHDFMPLRYAQAMVAADLGSAGRLGTTLGFLLQQARDCLAPLVMLALAARLSVKLSGTGNTPQDAACARASESSLWILALGFAPLTLMLLMGLLGGFRLENHWGTTALQFIALPLVAWMSRRRGALVPAAVLAAFLLVQVCEAVYVVTSDRAESAVTLEEGRVRAFDPAQFAAAVAEDWRRTNRSPLRYVVGPTMWGGFVSVYSPEHPQVLINGDPRASPWISLDELTRCGAIYIEPAQPPVDADAVRRGQFAAVDFSNARKGAPLLINWSVVPPRPSCGTRNEVTQ